MQSELQDEAFNLSVNGELQPALKTIQSASDVGLSEQLTETLRGIAYYTADEMEIAVNRLERLAADPGNYLASAALVWTYYDSGEIAKAEQLYEQLIEQRKELTGTAESDFGRVFLARLTTYAPGEADQRAINSLSGVIKRHRLWGFAYYARAEAHRDKFLRTKEIADLHAALEDDQMARLLLPHSDVVKSASLTLHLHAYQFAQMFPGKVDETRREEWRNTASELASQFSSRLSHWDGAANALAFYRATKQVDMANALESRIENKFAHLQPIRDLDWFETRSYQSFESELNTASPYTKHIYALALLEKGDSRRALELIVESIEGSRLNADVLVSAIEILQLMQEFDKCEELAKEYMRAEDSWDLWEWPVLILKYHAGELGEQELLDLACPFHSQVCIARHAVGVSLLARGDEESARRHFEAVLDTGRIGWGPFSRAKAYLRRLEENASWPED